MCIAWGVRTCQLDGVECDVCCKEQNRRSRCKLQKRCLTISRFELLLSLLFNLIIDWFVLGENFGLRPAAGCWQGDRFEYFHHAVERDRRSRSQICRRNVLDCGERYPFHAGQTWWGLGHVWSGETWLVQSIHSSTERHSTPKISRSECEGLWIHGCPH